MITLKQILIFVAWIACLCAAYAATLSVGNDFTQLPAFLTWVAFIFIALATLVVALTTESPNRKVWIGASVFAIAAILLFYGADMNVNQTPGSFLCDFLMAPSEQANSSLLQSDSTLFDDAEVLALPDDLYSRREGVADIVDVVVASLMTLSGALIGAYHNVRRMPDNN